MIPISNPYITEEDAQWVYDVVLSGQVSGRASPVKEFEQLFNDTFCYSEREVYAVANGTVALQLALESYPIKKGEPVVLPAHTYAACANAILDAGGIPVFADLDPDDSWNAGPSQLIETGQRSGAETVMVVHSCGEPVSMRNIRINFDKIIENCSESLGSYYKEENWESGKDYEYVGTKSYSDSTYSFYPNKLFTTGCGGAFTRQENLSDIKEERVLRLYNNGTARAGDFDSTIPAHNMRMSSLQAALGVSQLHRIDKIKMARQAVMDYYSSSLDGVIRVTNKERCPNPWLFGIYVRDGYTQRDAEEFLRDEYQIETRRPLLPLPSCPAFMKYSGGREFPTSWNRYKSWLFIPSSPTISCEDQERVIEGITAFMKAGG